MKLAYIANARIPTEKAHGFQIMKMCSCFTQYADVTLIVPWRWQSKGMCDVDPYSHYGVPTSFRIKKLWCFNLTPPLDTQLSRATNRLQQLAFYPLAFLFAITASLCCILKRFDVVYSREPYPLMILSLLGHGRLFFEVHNYPSTKLGQRLINWLDRRDVGMIFVSQTLKDKFNLKGLVAHNGADTYPVMTKEDAREALGIPQNRFIACYTGHLYKGKGADLLAKCCWYLLDIFVYLVGGTDSDIEAYRRDYQYDNLVLVGRVTHDKARLYQMAADILVLPTLSTDGSMSPLKLFEYMAANRPIIASDLPSITEVLNNKNAMLFEPDDAWELKGALELLISNKPLADKLANKALQDAQFYTWQERTKKIVRFMGI